MRLHGDRAWMLLAAVVAVAGTVLVLAISGGVARVHGRTTMIEERGPVSVPK